MTPSHSSSSPSLLLLRLCLSLLLLSPALFLASSAQPPSFCQEQPGGIRVLALGEGQYANGSLIPYSYDCYSVSLSSASADTEIRISLTSFAGDAEVFVSTSQQPFNLTYTWRGYDAGTSSIVIRQDDPNFCRAPCTYYISSYSHEYYAEYNIVVTQHGDNSPIAVYRNRPVNTLTPRGARQLFHYFPRNFEQTRGIRVTTTPSYGAAVIYVNVATLADVNRTSAYPTNTSYTWMSYSAFAGAFLHIHHTDPQFQSQCNPQSKSPDDYTGCAYLISVYQIFQHSTQYTLLVTQNTPVKEIQDPNDHVQDQHINLVNHVPFIRSVEQGEHEYYQALQLERGAEFYVSMTPLSGACYFLASKQSQAEYPDETTPAEQIVFDASQEQTMTYSFVVQRTAGVFNTFVYIGVRALYNCTYTITSNVYPPSRVGRFPARLTDGVPQFDSLRQFVRPEEQTDEVLNSWRYYVFYLPEPDALTLSVSKFMGDVDVFISGDYWSWNNSAYVDFAPPNATNYDFSITDHGLSSFNWQYAPAGRYVIGVYARAIVDYAISMTATFTDQILIANTPTAGYLRPLYNDTWRGWVNTAQYIFLLNNINASYAVPVEIAVTQLSGHVRVYVSDTNPCWYINATDPSTYNWTQSGQRLESIVIPPQLLRAGPYWIKVYAWEDATYTISAGYASYTSLQAGVPQNNWIPPHTSQYYSLTIPGQPDPVQPPQPNFLLTLVPLAGRASMVYNRWDPTAQVLPDHRNASTFNVYQRGNVQGFVSHGVELWNVDCRAVRCTYLIEVYTWEEGARYNLLAWSMAPGISNNQTVVLQHTVPQPGRLGATNITAPPLQLRSARYLFHVPLDNSTVTLALTPLGDFLNGGYHNLIMTVARCAFPTLSRGDTEWTRFPNQDPVLVIRPDDEAFRRPSRCPRFTPLGQAGVYYVTLWNIGAEQLYTLALSVRSDFSRYTNESSIVLVNELPQVGIALDPYLAHFRMFPVLPTQQIHIGLPEHSVLYHSTSVPYPNASTTTDVKDARLDTEWLQWPLTSNDTQHYFSLASGPSVFYITPKVYNGTNDTSVITNMAAGVAAVGRAYPGYVTHYEFFVTDFNVTALQVNLEVISGNPHLWLNYAPFNAPGSWRISNVTFPSYMSSWMNVTNPNFPVLRINYPPQGHYLLSINPANSSRAQADWKVTWKREYAQGTSDITILHDGVKASDWLWHNTTNWHLLRVPRYEGQMRGYQEVRLSLTSWFGDAEMFVTTSRRFDPRNPQFLWRGYDAGTSSLVINSSDPNWCDDCDYLVQVFSNEVSSYYSVVATLYGNYSYIPLTNHLPINHRTPVNSTQRFFYRPYNYELHHGFRVHISPAYGAAVFAIRVVRVSDYIGQPWPFPDGNLTAAAQWTSSGWFEGSWVHVSHLDAAFCTAHGGQVDVQDERSDCLYLISVSEPTGVTETQYTLLLQAVVPEDMLPKDGADYDPVQEPHNRLINHVAMQQYGEAGDDWYVNGNVTYYKTNVLNPQHRRRRVAHAAVGLCGDVR